MRITSKTIAILLLATMAAACATAPVSPVQDNPLISFYRGVWEGDVQISVFDGAKQMKDFPRTLHIKMIVRERGSLMYMRYSEAEPWNAIYLSSYTFSGTQNMISGTFFHSGKDLDGRWEEHQDMVLSRIDNKSAYLYLIRTVTNLDRKIEVPESKWASLSEGKLEYVGSQEGGR